jgi:2-oxoglutarate ferredoxin oxidoreductase subunit alpha
MQLLGTRFTAETALAGNDLNTLPNYPAEIRAPLGSIGGVSSFQIHLANRDITTPGDKLDLLVAMNPAALKANIADLARGGILIADTDEFTTRNLTKAGYETDPLADGSPDDFQVIGVNMTALTVAAVEPFGLGRKDAQRSKNMFGLGLATWLYSRPPESTEAFLSQKFAKNESVMGANLAAFHAGYDYGEATEVFAVRYAIDPAPMQPGTYRQINGNRATAFGLMVGAHLAGVPLFLGSYPITPATDILHELSKRKGYGVTTFQAEDEIAGVGSAIGASYGGALGVTTTSGPGLSLKSEAIGLAVMLELPLVVVDVQRAGPSTGMPTKTEQGDLLQAIYGRHGESPAVVLAPVTPADCFDMAVEAARIALTYRTPVILLTDSYLSNGAEPWKVPDITTLPTIDPNFTTEVPESGYLPYARDPETLARYMAIPGTPGLEHRVGGLEKTLASQISTDPAVHEEMVRVRADKVARVADTIPDLVVHDPTGEATILLLGWGSTYGPVDAAYQRLSREGVNVATAMLRYVNPMPANLGEVLARFDTVVVPEVNLGQLATLIRARYLKDVVSFTHTGGQPISSIELKEFVQDYLKTKEASK